MLIYRTAYSVTGSRADAEDVLQVVFLRLLRRGLAPDLEKNPKGYLYRAAINLALDTMRSRKRRRTESLDRVPAALHVVAQSLEDDDRRQRLRDAVAQLRPRAVEILILRYVHEYTDADIARMLGTSRGTIAVSLFRARAKLRKLLSVAAPGGTR